MPNTNLFYRYYDAIFCNKDYTKEIRLIFQFSKRFGVGTPQKILEIGCGTGNHTQELAKRGIAIVAVDTDENMIKLAKLKVKEENVRIKYTSVEKLRDSNFDLAVAMFNVVTYIRDMPSLASFMNAVAKRINEGGIFIFDCWNGVAAIKDPPSLKRGLVKKNGKIISYTVRPITDLFNQVTTLTYDIVAKEGRRTQKDRFSFKQTLWTPMQIRWAVKQAGFNVMLCSPLINIKRSATDSDWKIMFCCKKISK